MEPIHLSQLLNKYIEMKNQFTVILIGLSTSVFAQSIDNQMVSSGGNFTSRANGSLSSTLGEPSTQTLIRPQLILTQGFQQPEFVITDVSETDYPEIMVLIYPNPTTDLLHIKTNNLGFSYRVFDLFGKVLLANEIQKEEVVINLSPFNTSLFFIEIYSDTDNIKKTYKVAKL